jgi:hypothetical protein
MYNYFKDFIYEDAVKITQKFKNKVNLQSMDADDPYAFLAELIRKYSKNASDQKIEAFIFVVKAKIYAYLTADKQHLLETMAKKEAPSVLLDKEAAKSIADEIFRANFTIGDAQSGELAKLFVDVVNEKPNEEDITEACSDLVDSVYYHGNISNSQSTELLKRVKQIVNEHIKVNGEDQPTQGGEDMKEKVKQFKISHDDLLKALKIKFIGMVKDIEKHLVEYGQNMGFNFENEKKSFFFSKDEFKISFKNGKLLFEKFAYKYIPVTEFLDNRIVTCDQMLVLTKCTKEAIIDIKERIEKVSNERHQAYKEAWNLMEEIHENFDNINE